jgi:hypothetical protein
VAEVKNKPVIWVRRGNDYIAGKKPVTEGMLFIEKDCLRIRIKDGQVVLPIFSTQRTYWQDNKKALRASGKDWQLGATYLFGVKIRGLTNDIAHNEYNIIVPPHPSCDNQPLRYYVESSYEPDEFKQKRAAYMAAEKSAQ